MKAEFSFSEEWNGCGKIAEFRRYATSEPESVKLVGDACVIPAEALKGKAFKVSVIGIRQGFRLQTNMTEVKQDDWTPDVTPSLFAKVLIPDASVVPEWEQPDSTNPYMTGDKVTHNKKTWVSDVDNNVWEPGVYGWTEVEL